MANEYYKDQSEEKLDLIEKHTFFLSEFNNISSSVKEERDQNLEDRRFYSVTGAQWEGKLGEQFENKPKFEVNKTHISVMKIITDYRNSRITVDFKSKDGKDRDLLAQTCDGLYRASEQDSNADEAYDNCFEEGVGGGFGAWRLRAAYEDEEESDNEYQQIIIDPIYDADSCVYFDLGAKRQDKKDAKRCYILSSMTVYDYTMEWNDDPVSWPKPTDESEFDWTTKEAVYIAEVYEVEEKRATRYTYQGITGDEVKYTDKDFENNENLKEELIATGYTLMSEKKYKTRRVHKYIMSGGKILEDCGYIAGKNIPIVPFYGKRWFVDNVERSMGNVRLAKDMQRLLNMQISKLGEISAYGSVEKPIFTPEQVSGHENSWAEDNLKNYPYLLLNKITDGNGNEVAQGPIGYTKAPEVPAALAALLQLTQGDMRELLGNTQQEQLSANLATETVEMLFNRLDAQTFIYMSNFAKAMKRSGDIWLSMARDLFVEEGREMKTINTEGKTGFVTLMNPTMGEEGETIYENDLSQANLEVVSDVGPSNSTKKSATVRTLTQMMQTSTDPETQMILGSMAIMNTEGEGVNEVKGYFRNKLIRMGVIEPNKEELERLQEEAANAQPDPNAEYLRAAAANEEAKAQKAQADTIKTVAETEKIQAQVAEIMSDMDTAEQDRTLKALEAVKNATE